MSGACLDGAMRGIALLSGSVVRELFGVFVFLFSFFFFRDYRYRLQITDYRLQIKEVMAFDSAMSV